jgi:catalase-peroxidase
VFDHIQAEFNKAQSDDKKVSIADLIVLGGCAAIEKKQQSGHPVIVPLQLDGLMRHKNRQMQNHLMPGARSRRFRNYLKAEYTISSEEMLIDKAQLMTLTVPQMTVLLRIRVLNTNFDQSNNVFTQRQKC